MLIAERCLVDLVALALRVLLPPPFVFATLALGIVPPSRAVGAVRLRADGCYGVTVIVPFICGPWTPQW